MRPGGGWAWLEGRSAGGDRHGPPRRGGPDRGSRRPEPAHHFRCHLCGRLVHEHDHNSVCASGFKTGSEARPWESDMTALMEVRSGYVAVTGRFSAAADFSSAFSEGMISHAIT